MCLPNFISKISNHNNNPKGLVTILSINYIQAEEPRKGKFYGSSPITYYLHKNTVSPVHGDGLVEASPGCALSSLRQARRCGGPHERRPRVPLVAAGGQAA